MKEIEESQEFNPAGVVAAALPVLAVASHLLWPRLVVLKYAAVLLVLLAVAFLLSALSARSAGRSEFHIHFGWMVLLLLAGVPLFRFYGWISIAWVAGGCFLAVMRYFILYRSLVKRGELEEGVIFLPDMGLLDLVIPACFILLNAWLFRRYGPPATLLLSALPVIIALALLIGPGGKEER